LNKYRCLQCPFGANFVAHFRHHHGTGKGSWKLEWQCKGHARVSNPAGSKRKEPPLADVAPVETLDSLSYEHITPVKFTGGQTGSDHRQLCQVCGRKTWYGCPGCENLPLCRIGEAEACWVEHHRDGQASGIIRRTVAEAPVRSNAQRLWKTLDGFIQRFVVNVGTLGI